MSIEMRASVERPMQYEPLISAAIAADDEYEALATSSATCSNELRMRMTDRPARNTWPEDIALFFGESEIVIAFHSVDGRGRRRFCDLIESVLANNGITERFREM